MSDRCRTHQTRACETCDDMVDAAETLARLEAERAEAIARLEAKRQTAVTPCACSAQRARAEAAEAERDRLRAGIEALLADGPDTWQGYDSRDTGHTFLADSVLDFTAELRALLAGGPDVRADLMREWER